MALIILFQMKTAQTEVKEMSRKFEEDTHALREEKTALEIEVAELTQVGM